MNELRVRRTRATHNTRSRFGANVATLSPVGSQLAIVDEQQRYRREARHTKNNSTELPREGRGRWREKERKEIKQKERERREGGRVEGQLVPEEGQNETYVCTSICARRGRGGEGHGERCNRCISRVYALDSTSLRVVRLSYENKTDTQAIDILHLRLRLSCRTLLQLISIRLFIRYIFIAI